MKKHSVKFLPAAILCLSFLCPPQLLLAQQQQGNPFDTGARARLKIPKNAIVGSNAERRAAWDRLSEAEKSERLEKFKAILNEAKAKSRRSPQTENPPDTVLTFTNQRRSRTYVNAKTKEPFKSENGGSSVNRLLEIYDRSGSVSKVAPSQLLNAKFNKAQASPIGFLDIVDTNTATIAGWSFDPDNPAASNEVHIYIKNLATGVQTPFGVIANQPRPDVNQAFGIPGDHGFTLQIPPQYMDGGHYSVSPYGIDTGADEPTLLSNAPLTFSYGASGGMDADTDGLPDNFETSLADGFTPVYHVSAGERPGTGFATFNNSLPLSVNQLFGPVPPISYYRVKPMGTGSIGGVQHGFIQLDYLTLWNRDDGLEVGTLCYAQSLTIGITVEIFPGHDLDRERSATLVAAPLVNGNYDTNFANYKAYSFFTAAHEDTFGVDQSLYLFPQTPIDFGWHINLALSRSKHATYPFNPDYLPIIQSWIIFSTYETIEFYYQTGQIDPLTYLSLLYIAESVFFACVIEHFQEQGGTFAGVRINVGELPHPINNSSFIQDSDLTQKLNKLLF